MTIPTFDTPYPGGKNGDGVYQTIINLIPPHTHYIEPFAGSGAILRRKRPAQRTTLLDLNLSVIRDWNAIAFSIPIPYLEIIHGDALVYLTDHPIEPTAFVYCDPPYLLSTRSAQRPIYEFEMLDQAEHTALIQALRRLPCPVMLSGYHSPLYADLLHDWHTHTYQAMTRGGHPATEYLWMNYPAPTLLHDYQYLGANFRQRESLKRQKSRWLKRLREMSPLKRQALLAALSELE